MCRVMDAAFREWLRGQSAFSRTGMSGGQIVYGKLLIVAPDDICGLSTLSKSHEKLQMMYEKGMRDAEKIGEFLKA